MSSISTCFILPILFNIEHYKLLTYKNQLEDYGINLKQISILSDNTSAIELAKNPIVHSRTKHIEVKHHFLHDHITKADTELKFVNTSSQIVDVFTKPLVGQRFAAIFRELSMLGGRDLDVDHTLN